MNDQSDLLRRLGAAAPGPERDDLLAKLSSLTGHLVETTGRGLDLNDQDLGGLDLGGADLRRASLSRANLHGTKLVRANLREITAVCPGMERTDLTGADLTHAYIHALAAQTCTFDDADLTGLRDATGTLFHGCSLKNVILTGSQLAGSSFYQCDLTRANLDEANLQGSLVNECLLVGASLRGALLDQVSIVKVALADADLSGASGRGLSVSRPTSTNGLRLTGAHLTRLRLDNVRGARWDGQGLAAPDADLADVTLLEANFTGADFSRSMWRAVTAPGAMLVGLVLSDAKMSGCALMGSNLANAYAENLALVECDLASVDLSGATARCLTARDVNLAGADLSHANLYRAMLTGDPPKAMNLRGASLQNAVLVQAYIAGDLTRADLRGANAAYSRFSQSCLDGALLDGVNMHESTWVKTSFVDATLANVRPPVFADRCRGLSDAVDKSAGQTAEELGSYLEDLAGLLGASRKGST